MGKNDEETTRRKRREDRWRGSRHEPNCNQHPTRLDQHLVRSLLPSRSLIHSLPRSFIHLLAPLSIRSLARSFSCSFASYPSLLHTLSLPSAFLYLVPICVHLPLCATLFFYVASVSVLPCKKIIPMMEVETGNRYP